jgi:dihydroneopterin aldolase
VDIIYINDLRVNTVIGVWEWERRIRQTLVMHFEMGVDISFAGESDDLSKTVDYKAVSDRVMDFTRKSEFKLVEALAEKISEIILKEFGVRWLRLTISKQGVLEDVKDVGIVIERGERF